MTGVFDINAFDSDDDTWVPMPGERLTCTSCGSANTRRIKRRDQRGGPVKDYLRCDDCDSQMERWERARGGRP